MAAELITMPKLSDTMKTGTLVKWLKSEGDTVQSGDLIAEIETDKATMEFESFTDGVILKIYTQAGSQAAIGAPLCAIGQKGDALPDVPEPAAPVPKKAKESPKTKEAMPSKAAPEKKEAEKSAPKPSSAAPVAPASAPKSTLPSGKRIKISPLARKLAAEKGIDPANIQGSGPDGRIVRADVLAAEKSGGAVAALGGGVRKGPIQEDRIEELSNFRSVIAERLLESKTQIPHFYLTIEVDCDPLLSLRQQLNSTLAEQGVKLSVNDFILKASAEALRKVPAVNASWEEEGIHYHGPAHVSFAVAIAEGLITPVIRDAQEKTVFQISTEAKTLGKLARDKKLKPDQFSGGTFCVSNLGMMGIEQFCAIINPPNAAILAVGTTVRKPVVTKDDKVIVSSRMKLTLSSDHRIVDGSVGAEYLAALKYLLENPALLLI